MSRNKGGRGEGGGVQESRNIILSGLHFGESGKYSVFTVVGSCSCERPGLLLLKKRK